MQRSPAWRKRWAQTQLNARRKETFWTSRARHSKPATRLAISAESLRKIAFRYSRSDGSSSSSRGISKRGNRPRAKFDFSRRSNNLMDGLNEALRIRLNRSKIFRMRTNRDDLT